MGIWHFLCIIKKNDMIYATFIYKNDEELLRMSAARIKQLDPEAVIYAVNDANAPMRPSIPQVRFMSSQYNRGGNLNGVENLGGQLAVFQRILAAEGADYLIKFDADMWANDLGPFLRTLPEQGIPVPDYLATENWEAFRPSGHIYRVSRWLVNRLVQMYNERSAQGLWPKKYHYPEDQTIFRMAALSGLKCELVPFESGYSTGQLDGGPGTNEACLRAGVVHCGEPLPNGARASREHVTLRRRILKYETEKKEKNGKS